VNNRSQTIITRLENCVRSRGGVDVSVAAVASMCDVSRQMLHMVVRGERRLPDGLGARLDALLTEYEKGELTFHRGRAEYHVPPNPLPPPQARMVRAIDFVEWARCCVCGGPRYTLVTLHGAPAAWYLCDGCSWWETAGIGARPVSPPRRKTSSQK
jgi:hypothetical protein